MIHKKIPFRNHYTKGDELLTKFPKLQVDECYLT